MRKCFGSVSWYVVAAAVVLVVAVIAVVAVRDISRGSGLSELYRYQSAGLGDVPDELIGYAELDRSFDTGFERVADFDLCDDGYIYVAGDRSVAVFDVGGHVQKRISTDAESTAVKVYEGMVYVGLGDHVVIYDDAGQVLQSWDAASERSLITSIEVYRDNVFVADSGQRVVLRYDGQGNFMNYIGRADEDRNVPGIVLPTRPCLAVAMADDGLLRVNNSGRHRIEAYTFDGDLEWWWGRASAAIEGFCGCCNPSHFTVFDGDRYVTAEKSLIRIKVYDGDGNLESVVAGADVLMPGALERFGQRTVEPGADEFKVAVDDSGLIYVLDPVGRRVRFFERVEDE